MTLSRRDREVRREIEEKYRYVFSEYENDGGIPMRELQGLLSGSKLPKHKISQIVHSADRNRDQRITYDEFLQQVLFEGDKVINRLRIHKRLLNRTIKAIAPDAARQHQQVALARLGYDQVDAHYWGEADVNNYVEAYDCRPPPIFIPIITMAEIAVFIYYAVMNARDSDPSNDVTASSGYPRESSLIYYPAKRHEAWRFLTYMFIHNGYTHLLFNCLLQFVLGTLLELVHKFWRCGLVYLLGVIAGSLLHSVIDAHLALVGASGGCYALIGAHLASVIMNWKSMQEGWLEDPVKFLSSGVVRLVLILLLAGCDTGFAIYDRCTKPLAARVGVSAHIGGFVAGILIGIPVLRNLEVERWEKVCFWLCLVIYALFTIAAVLFNVFCARIHRCPGSI